MLLGDKFNFLAAAIFLCPLMISSLVAQNRFSTKSADNR